MYSVEEGKLRRVPKAFLGTAGPICFLEAELALREGLANQRDGAGFAREKGLSPSNAHMGRRGSRQQSSQCYGASLLPALFIL